MAVLDNIGNKVNSCSGDQILTGKVGCNVEFFTPLHLIGLKRGTIIPLGTDFNQAYINSLVQLGIAVPLVGADNFEPLSSEDSMFTYASGIEVKNLEGLPKYKLTYREDHQFYREMAKLEGFKNLDFIIGDNKGNWKMVVTSSGDWKGFTAGMVLPEITQDRIQGGDPESKSLQVQFTNRREWDINYVIFLRENLDNDPEDFQGVNGVDLTFDVVPADAAVEIVVKAVISSDMVTPVEGLDVDDFLYTAAGSTEVPSGVVESPEGVYTFTVTALVAVEELTIQNYDSSANKNVVISDSGVTYRSNVLAATVV
jgi:hypothetical protein